MKPCKRFTGYVGASGYGRMYNPRTRKNDNAHRVFYERLVGPIPEGYDLDHLCRFKACVEVTHLEAVPHFINCWRGRSTKLTEQDVKAIRASSLSSKKIAPLYGVHDSTIRRIRRFEHFAGLGTPAEQLEKG